MTDALFRTVLVPHDFSPHATAALRTAADLASAAGGRLVVLHAIPPYDTAVPLPPLAPEVIPPPMPSAEMIASERQRLEAVVERALRGARRPVVECRVVVADPFRAILDVARSATAIVMGTLGRTGLSHLLLGSVAEKVVRHAPVPVLTVRGRGRSSGRQPQAA